MRISNDIIEKLQALKGMNLDVAYRITKENKLDVKQSGFAENVIAMLLDRPLPKNDKGEDFKGLFEVKEVKVNFTKKGEMRTGGDTNISAYINSESNFFESNIWDKTNRILIVCVNSNREIVDVRFFDGSTYAEQMKSDYEAIKEAKNLCRQNNKILVFKTGFNSIMLKGNTAIDMSESILSDDENDIADQFSYIHNILDDKFINYQEKSKNVLETIYILMNRLSIADLELIRKMSEQKIIESVGFDLNAGNELEF